MSLNYFEDDYSLGKVSKKEMECSISALTPDSQAEQWKIILKLLAYLVSVTVCAGIFNGNICFFDLFSTENGHPLIQPARRNEIFLFFTLPLHIIIKFKVLGNYKFS